MGELYEPFPKLPKNIRQIGERDQVLKLYLEDYVNTYLRRLQPAKGADLRVGLLLGSRETHEDTPYVFVDGALEMDSVTEEGEKVVFSEDAWKKAYQDVEQMFPKRTVQGWFLCGGPGCTLSPLTYWKQHSQYFTGKNQLMYLNCGLEGEEAVYITSSDGFYKLRGYSVYYERNQMMQDYMILRKDVPRAEAEVDDKVIRDFKQRMDERKNEAGRHRSTVGVLSGICSVLAVTVLAGGVAMFNNYQKMHQMESVIASVMPEGSVKQGLLASAGKGSCRLLKAARAMRVKDRQEQRAREARQASQRDRQANRPLTKTARTRIRPQDRVTASQRDSPKARQTSPQTSQQPHPQPRIPRRPPVKGRPRHLRKQNHRPRKGQRRQPPAPARMPHPRPFQRLIIAFIRWKRERHYMVSVLSCIMT